MSYLIPTLTLKELQSMTPAQVKGQDSVILADEDGNYLGELIVPQTDYIKMQAEFMGQLSNGVKPHVDAVPSIEAVDALACPDCGKVCKSKLGLNGHMRSHADVRV